MVFAMKILPAEIIKKKRNKSEITAEEIDFIIQGYTQGTIPDYQMSALLMAIFFNGMNDVETLHLTKSMLQSGDSVHFDRDIFAVDKHSTGGVGDKTSLILAPIVAAAGIRVPMISGRGLGHTGGTLDKLESIPGFQSQLSLPEFKSMVEKHLLSFIGQTGNICPADKKIYALRDVTATVESYPLICASIMSKKIAEGIHGLVLDIKCGSGAFMKTPDQAKELASRLMNIAKGYGLKVNSLITNMNQPLGRFAGNSLEIFECLEIMKNKTHIGPQGYDLYEDTRELSLDLAAQMIFVSGKMKCLEDAKKLSLEILTSGKAFDKFKEIIALQRGHLEKLPMPTHQKILPAPQDGYIETMNVEKIGLAGVKIGAGRAIVSDIIQPTAGIEFTAKVGDFVKKGDPLFIIHGNEKTQFHLIEQDLLESIIWTPNKVSRSPLVLQTLQ